MLTSLSIKNYALIANLSVDFSSGFIVYYARDWIRQIYFSKIHRAIYYLSEQEQICCLYVLAI
jgi:hypothetical protein